MSDSTTDTQRQIAGLLSTIETTPAGMHPELMVPMAKQVERLATQNVADAASKVNLGDIFQRLTPDEAVPFSYLVDALDALGATDE